MPPSSSSSFYQHGPISVPTFLSAIREDLELRTTGNNSGFSDAMPSCRARILAVDEALDTDREGLQKLKKTVKAIGNSGTALSISEAEFAQCLKNLGEIALTNDDHQPEALGKGFINFAGLMDAVTKHSRAMYQTFTNLFLYPLDTLLKNESLASKGDLKKAIDKAWKDYEVKSTKVEKEKKQNLKESGQAKNDYVTPAELADELLEERRMFQLQMCECLIKENDIRSRKGVDLLSHLIEYYYALLGYFEDGMKTLKDYQSFIHDISAKAQEMKSKQEEEKKQLYEMRKLLKGGSNSAILRDKTSSVTNLAATPVVTNGNAHTGYNLHQLQGNKSHGTNKKGILYKKCESKMRRKQWQKRKCEVKGGFLSVAHNDETKSPVKLNLLTCQAKVVLDDKRCFDLVSKFRTYHFQAEDEHDKDVWLSVILNSKEQVLQQAFGRDATENRGLSANISEIRDSVIKQVQKLPGNNRCCDCDAEKTDLTWLSTNFGVLTCIECSGVHRELGVHVSRVQSLTLDHLGTGQLLLARSMTNLLFNQIFESSVNNVQKPTAASRMEDRNLYIRAKYVERRFVTPTCPTDDVRQEALMNALHNRHLHGLVQLFAEGVDLSASLADSVIDETPLHFLVRAGEDGLTLACADFIIQNCRSTNRTDRNGNTALHLCAEFSRPETAKLLLRASAQWNLPNNGSETALDIAQRKGNSRIVELFQYAQTGKKEMFDNVDVDWTLFDDEFAFDNGDYSDDEAEGSEFGNGSSRRSFRTARTPNQIAALGSSYPSSTLLKNSQTTNLHTITNTASSSSIHKAPLVSSISMMAPPSNPKSTFTSFTPLQRKESTNTQPSNYSAQPREPVEPVKLIKKHSAPAKDLHTDGENIRHPVSEKRTTVVVDPRHLRATSDPKTVQEMVRAGSDMPSLPVKTKYSNTSALHGQSNDNLSSAGIYPSGSDSRQYLDNGGVLKPKPPPRRREGFRRCKALFDCEADHPDELSFRAGDIIQIINTQTDDENWMEGMIETANGVVKRGLFPVSFVHMLPDT
ncbi:hypothetical protein RvY_14541 [Ramazzottius varieornatus]|uniref:Uncharacterized protein n=1 Tax=Ramazzottius varieornatus TaxID=947166 RepID=A0A1D1VRS5_RAMVA|nr:hypothetical protein RvY_14541 [Ramazzottius varieornatus]